MPGPYDELEKEAERLEKQSKNEFGKKNFISAISLIKEAKDIYSKLGFQGKIGMIDKRIAQLNNLVKFEKQDSDMKTKGEEVFQKRVDEVIKEKQRYTEKILSEQRILPPEIKRKLERIDLLVEKAEKEEKLKKYSRVIGRYEYILEIYNSIPKDIGDFSQRIYEIEKKIAMLQTKK
jgi:mevalonate kinase